MSETFENEGVCTKTETYDKDGGAEGATCDEANVDTYLTTSLRGAGANATDDALNFDADITNADTTDPAIFLPKLSTKYNFYDCADCPPGTAQMLITLSKRGKNNVPCTFERQSVRTMLFSEALSVFPMPSKTYCENDVNSNCQKQQRQATTNNNQQFSCSAQGL